MNAALHSAKNVPKVKRIVESFEGSGILVTQPKVSLQTTDLATNFLNIKDRSEFLVNLIGTKESAKYTTNWNPGSSLVFRPEKFPRFCFPGNFSFSIYKRKK